MSVSRAVDCKHGQGLGAEERLLKCSTLIFEN